MLSYGIATIYGLTMALEYGLLTFFTTFFVYNFQRIVKHAQLPNPSVHMQWVERYKPWLFILTIISFCASGYLFFRLFQWSFSSLIVLVVGGIISFFYIVRIGSKNLREVPHIKIHLIALTWVLMVGVFPLLNESIPNEHNWWFAGIHYPYVLAVTIPFDIRDLKHDSPKQLTFPQLLGIRNAIVLSLLLLGVFVGGVTQLEPTLAISAWFWSAMLLTTLLILFSKEDRPDYYFGGLLDGVIFLLGLSYCFL